MELDDAASLVEREVRKRLQKMEESIEDEDVMRELEHFVFSSEEFEAFSLGRREEIIKKIFYNIKKDMGILHPLIEDREISEIMVNGIRDIFVEKKGDIRRADIEFADEEELEDVIRRIAGKVQREFNEMNPILDARLPDGSRVNAIYKNVSLNGPTLTIRKFPEKALTISDMIDNGTITKEASDFLKVLIECGFNCFISGGTSSGKTTMLNVLTDFIPGTERLVIIEDSAELQINSIDNVVRLECRMANSQGLGQITMTNLIKASLRMRPDRIIVGEVRGSETVDMIQAMNTGHDGSISTGHGNSITGMLNRLEAMYQQGADIPLASIRSQISQAIDVIVHMIRLPGGRRRVVEISEITGFEENGFTINPLFVFDEKKDALVSTGAEIVNREKFRSKGMGYDTGL